MSLREFWGPAGGVTKIVRIYVQGPVPMPVPDTCTTGRGNATFPVCAAIQVCAATPLLLPSRGRSQHVAPYSRLPACPGPPHRIHRRRRASPGASAELPAAPYQGCTRRDLAATPPRIIEATASPLSIASHHRCSGLDQRQKVVHRHRWSKRLGFGRATATVTPGRRTSGWRTTPRPPTCSRRRSRQRRRRSMWTRCGSCS